LVASEVSTTKVLASDDVPAPYLLVLDEVGAIRVGAAASWAKLDANRVRLSHPGPLSLLDRFLRLRFAEGISGKLAVASISILDEELELAREGERNARPEPIGSTRKASERTAPAAEKEATERARATAGLAVDREGSGFPRRATKVRGSVLETREIAPNRPMVLAPPALRARALIDMIASTGATIAVSHAGRIRPLRLDFETSNFSSDCWRMKWIELRVSRANILVEAVPGVPIDVLDIKDLANAIDQVRKAPGLVQVCPEVDVLLDPDVDTQRLVDLLAALDIAGVRRIGIGAMPEPRELALRGHRIPSTSMSQSSGSFDRATWFFVSENINRCYDEALVAHSNLAGAMTVKFFIESDGKVTSATASGVDPALAACIANGFKKAELPKPARGARKFELTFYP
jgi:hypothetical protein